MSRKLIFSGTHVLRVLALACGMQAMILPAFASAVPIPSDLNVSENTQQASVDGFRSAKFGMSRDDVRASIKADFELDTDAIVESINRAERTQVLTVLVPDLLPEGGTAQVSYVFGYKSGELIQVGVSWSVETDPAITDETLYSNADALAAHFIAAGYKPETLQTGVALDSGVLLFRGEDAEGRTTLMLLQGSYSDTSEGQRRLKPETLAVLYAASAENPDIFKIEPGQF